MTDLFGVQLNVGDKVVYTTGAQSNQTLEAGTIYEIDDAHWTHRDGTRAGAMIITSSGRKAQLWRSSYCLVSVKPIQTQHPELFI